MREYVLCKNPKAWLFTFFEEAFQKSKNRNPKIPSFRTMNFWLSITWNFNYKNCSCETVRHRPTASSSSSSSKFIVRLLQNGHRCITESQTLYKINLKPNSQWTLKANVKKWVLSCFLKTARSWLARMSSGSAFHAAGPACEKASSPNFVRSRGNIMQHYNNIM